MKEYLISLPSARKTRDEITEMFERWFDDLSQLDFLKHAGDQVTRGSTRMQLKGFHLDQSGVTHLNMHLPWTSPQGAMRTSMFQSEYMLCRRQPCVGSAGIQTKNRRPQGIFWSKVQGTMLQSCSPQLESDQEDFSELEASKLWLLDYRRWTWRFFRHLAPSGDSWVSVAHTISIHARCSK